MRQIRQGDVLLVRVDVSVEEFLQRDGARRQSVPRKHGRVVLAHGEATGHAHVVESEEASLITSEGAQELFLLVHGTAPVSLVHPEHDPLAIGPGVYRVVRQREYSWMDDRSWDWVRD